VPINHDLWQLVHHGLLQLAIIEPINSDTRQRSRSEHQSPAESSILLPNKCIEQQRINNVFT
jgi:hypothetical protein